MSDNEVISAEKETLSSPFSWKYIG